MSKTTSLESGEACLCMNFRANALDAVLKNVKHLEKDKKKKKKRFTHEDQETKEHHTTQK